MILITGAGGLIGYSVSNFFLNKNYQIFGIENNKRKILFGKQGSVEKNIINLKKHKKFKHLNIDILIGAYRNNLKITEVPVIYRERIAGKTKMTSVFKNGLRMLWIVFYSFYKIRIKY